MSSQELERSLKQSVIVPVTTETGSRLIEAERDLDAENRALKREIHASEMKDREAARDQRKVYARLVYILVCLWIVAIFALLVGQVFGASWTTKYRPLSDGVLIALISSTTVNLIGTLIVVLKYIFRVPGEAS